MASVEALGEDTYRLILSRRELRQVKYAMRAWINSIYQNRIPGESSASAAILQAVSVADRE